jgi:hypothetical protein
MALTQMIILHSLVILSLIIPNLAAWTSQSTPIQQPPSQRSSPLSAESYRLQVQAPAAATWPAWPPCKPRSLSTLTRKP